LNFDGDPDHRLDTGIVFRIFHYWEIRKAVNGHSFITIRQMAALVRRALAEVCTVPVLLVITANITLKSVTWTYVQLAAWRDTVISTVMHDAMRLVYMRCIYTIIKTTSVGDATVSASQEQTLSGSGASVYTCTCVHDNIPCTRLPKYRPIGASLLTTSPQQGCLALVHRGWLGVVMGIRFIHYISSQQQQLRDTGAF